MRILLLLFLASCGQLTDMRVIEGDIRHKSDIAFASHKRRFENEFNISVKVPIIFNNLEKNIAGVCYIYSSGYREVQIDKQTWLRMSEQQQEQIIYHELGHCVLDKEHDDSKMGNCPNSIMRSISFSSWEIDNCYIPEYNHYMDDLRK